MKRFNVSTWALLRHGLLRYLMVVIVLAGAYAYVHLGQAEDPEFTFRAMLVLAEWPGASAREMEQQVTARLEKKLQETPYLDFVHSYAKPGETVLVINLREDTPKGKAEEIFLQVRKKIADIRGELPDGVRGPFFDDEFGDTFGSVYAVVGEGYSAAKLRDHAEALRQRILRVPDVGKANLVGEQAEKIYVEFDNERLATLGVDPLSIISALQAQNALRAPASVDTAHDRLATRISGEFRSVDEIADANVAGGARPLRLRDIAAVRRGYEDPPRMQMRYMGREAIGLEVSMAAHGDILALAKNLRSTVAEFQRELPLGVEVHQVADQPAVVKRQVNLFMQSLVEALAIVLAIGFIALGTRAGLVIALAIPIVLAITFIGMLAFGISLQRVSLGALIIALGLLVDDAMITAESMSVRLARGWRSLRAAAFSYRATALPMLTGTLITAAGFMPVGLANSATGEYTFSIFAVVAIALIASWVVAVVFTPYLGFLLLRPRSRRRKGLYKTPFYRAFRRFVTWCVDYRKTVIALTVVLFVACLYAFRFVEQQFFPISDRNEVVVEMWLPEGAPFASTLHEVERLEAMLAGLQGIQNYAAYVGRGAPHFFLAMEVEQRHSNFANVIVTCDGADARDAVYRRLRTTMLEEFPAVRARVTRFESGPPVGYPVQFRVLGDDPAMLRAAADRVADVMRAHPATRDIYADWHEVIKTVRLDFDEDRARALGVSPRELGVAISMMLNGAAVTQYREGDRLIDVVMRASDKDRMRVEGLADLAVRTSSGRYVPLSQLVVASYGLEQGKLWRRNGSTEIAVRADIDESTQAPDVTSALEPAVYAIAASLPPGYRIEVGGAKEASIKSQGPILAVIPLMVIVIVTLLMLQLRSFKSSVRVLISAPLGVAGVTLSLLIFRQPFGFVAMLGVIALAGIIMRNSVILVEQIERLIAASQNPRRAIIEGVVRRFRPIALTAAATILAMIPLAQSVFWRPIAVAMMGGTFVATVLTLAFEPAMYALWFGVARRSKPAADRARARPVEDADSDLTGAAARGDALECARWIESGCDIDARDAAGSTALMLATDGRHHDIMRMLIDAGADVDARSGVGTTALMRAATRGDAIACRILIEAGAAVDASLHGVTALALAKRRKHVDAVAVLSAAA